MPQAMLINPDKHRYNGVVRALNRRLASIFGYVNSFPRFQWKLTNELYFDRQLEGKFEEVELDLGNEVKLILLRRSMERKLLSEYTGAVAWCMAQMTLPSHTYEQHKIVFGDTVPWYGNGRYTIVNGTSLNLDDYPDADVTEMIVAFICAQLELAAKDAVEQVRENQERVDNANRSIAKDIIDDSITAFGQKPGVCEETWFGVPGLRDINGNPKPTHGESPAPATEVTDPVTSKSGKGFRSSDTMATV